MADDDLDILAWTMLGEAGGQGQQGMADVGHVVLNRVNSGRYGASIQDVALAPKQFSTWNSGAGGNDPKGKYPKDSPEFKRAREIAAQVVAGTIPGPPGKPLDYTAESITPYWADSKNKHGTYTRNGHTMYPSVPVPPGELPEVATALSTGPTPRPPMPVTPSIDLAQYRKNVAPSQLGPETFARLAKPQRNLGDEIGMSPIPGGKQQAPLFDAGFDTRTNEMRLFSNGPADTQGVFAEASKAPAPVPAMPSPQLMGKRATDQVLQAALNAKYPAQLPPMGPTTRPVATTTIRPSASDLVRGNPMQTKEQATTIASIPTTGFPTTEQIVAGTGFRPPPAIPDRLMAGEPGLPALYGGNIAGVGTKGIAPMPFNRPPAFQPPVQMAARKVAPIPFNRPTGVGTQLSTQPMPPLPIPRPDFGMGGPLGPAPTRPQMPNPTTNLTGKLQQPTAGEFIGRALMDHTAGGQLLSMLTGRKGNPRGGLGGLMSVLSGGKGGNAPAGPSLYRTNPIAFGNAAVSQSGDTSVGSQADAAAARSSGEGGRNRRY
jgi:hypothetical protein